VESFTWSPHLLPGIAILCRPHDVVTPLPKAAQVNLTDLLKVREAAEPWFFPLVFSPFSKLSVRKKQGNQWFYVFSLSKIWIEQHKLGKRWWKTGEKTT
jgi:hypothetical protein